MANGFTQRFRGKVQATQLWLQGIPLLGAPGVNASYSTAGTQTLGNEPISSINASSAISIWTLGSAPVPGVRKVLELTAVSSGAFIKAAAGTAFDASTNTVMKSTYPMRIELVGVSTVRWSIVQAYPDTTAGGAPVGGITLSTTT